MRKLLLLNCVICVICGQNSYSADRPNIILILVDDMGATSIGSYGGYVETPNLDRLAGDGIRFSNFYNAARCCPTRASLMTGLHPHQVGIGHMTLPFTGNEFRLTEEDRAGVPSSYQGWLSRDIPTLPEMLKDAGYATYMVGKWHLASPEKNTWPLQRGFDRFYGHLAGTSHYYAPENLYRGNEHIQPEGKNYYITDAITDEAINFLKDHSTKEPFFLYLAYNAPHFPLHCMPEDYNKYRGRFKEGWDKLRAEKLKRQQATGVVPLNTKLSPRPEKIPAWDELDAKKQDEMDAIMATYAGMVDRIDRNIGKLVAHLTATGELDDTMICFLTDNGAEAETGPLGKFRFEDLGKYGAPPSDKDPDWTTKYGKGWASLSNTPYREYKHYTHQGGVSSPLIVHWPKVVGKSGRRSQFIHDYAYLPDLVETCLDVAGASRPREKNGQPVPAGEGHSFAKLLAGDQDGPLHTEPICIEHEGNRLVRSGQWKLVAYDDQPWELFDLDNDRSETNDLAAQNPEVVKALEKAYNDFANRAGVLPWSKARKFSVYKK